MKKNSSIFTYFLTGALLIFTDQLIKYFINRYYPSLVFGNKGVIFGWVQNEPIGYMLLIIGIILLVYIVIQQKKQGIVNYLALTLIISGAAANLLDRLRFGHVVDYIHFFNLNVFNLADIYIFLGILFYIFSISKVTKK